VRVSLEVGHHYANDRLGLRRQLQREYALVPQLLDVEATIGVLIDDYNAELPAGRDEAIAYVSGQHADLDFVQFESDGQHVGLELLARAGRRIDVGEDGHRLRRTTRAESSSVLVAEHERLCCPTLAATWVLARLGVQPYADAYHGVGEFQGDRVLTVLPRRYLRGEATVLDLLDAAGYAKQARRVGYVFH
jgi:hypothetical protein